MKSKSRSETLEVKCGLVDNIPKHYQYKNETHRCMHSRECDYQVTAVKDEKTYNICIYKLIKNEV